ncbi:MAG TPA: drug/metabolite exporter YedA [Thermoanaerobaculia bacterium]|nr:drug/metabolite exporter YedA [Thermoanaerobaculia bacterium]
MTAPATTPTTAIADQKKLLLPLAFAAVYLIWGSTYLAIRLAVETMPPFLLAGIRHLVAGAMLYGYLRLSGVAPPSRQQWLGALAVGTLLLCGGNGLVTYAQQTVPSGLTALLIATVPLWMIVLHRFVFRGDSPALATWFGVALGAGGVVLLIGPDRIGFAGTPLAGMGMLLVAAVLWAFGSLWSRRLTLPPSLWMSAAAQMLTGGPVLLVVASISGEWAAFEPAQVSTSSILAFVYLVVFGSIVGMTAYLYMLRYATPAAVGTYAFVNPAVAVMLGWLVLGETLDARSSLAMLLILGGVATILAAQALGARRVRRRACEAAA